MPGAESLGPVPSGRSGRPIANYDTSSEWQGVANFGQGIQQAAAVVKANWNVSSATEAESRFQQWKFGEMKLYDEAVQNMPPGGAQGFAENYTKGYFERAKAFRATLPPDLQPDYDLKLFDTEQSIYGNALDFERATQKTAAIASLGDAVTNALLPKAEMAAKLPFSDPNKAILLAEAEADAIKMIDGNPALTPIEKDEQKRKVRQLIQTSFANALSPEERVNVDPSNQRETYGERIRALESGGDPTAGNPDSSALGPDQFTKGTWLGLVKKYHPEIARGETDAEILALRTDSGFSGEMRDLYLRENAAFLDARGYAASAGNLYLAHFLGPAGAVQMLGADPNVSAADINPAAAKANPTVFYHTGGDRKPDPTSPRSVGEIVRWADGRMGGARIADWGRQLDAVPYDTKIAIAMDGSAAMVKLHADQLAAQKASYDAWLNGAKNAILDNRFGLSDVQTAYEQGVLTDAGDRNALIEAIQKRDKETLDYAKAASLLGDTSQPVNPFSKDHQTLVNLWYDKGPAQGGDNLLNDPATDPTNTELRGQPSAVQMLRAVVDRTGMVPESAVENLKAGFWSANPSRRDAAFTIMDGLYRQDPMAVGRAFSADDMKRLQDYQALAPLLPPDELNKRLDPSINPQQMELTRKVEADARKQASDASPNNANYIGADKVLEAFDTSPGFLGFGGVPTASPDPVAVESMMTDFYTLYGERYAVAGNRDVAKAQAIERLKQKWGASMVGTGNVLMAYPPERYYPEIGGNHDWMDEQLDTFVTAQVSDAQSYSMIPTPQTEADISARRPPSYYVGVVDGKGVFRLIGDGVSAEPAMVRFDPDKALADSRAAFEKKRANALATQQQNAERWKLGVDAGQNPSIGTGAGPDIPFSGDGPALQ